MLSIGDYIKQQCQELNHYHDSFILHSGIAGLNYYADMMKQCSDNIMKSITEYQEIESRDMDSYSFEEDEVYRRL